MNNRPVPKQIILTDTFALMSLLFLVMFWIGCFILITLQVKGSVIFLVIGSATTIILLPALIWRIRIFYSIFADNLEVPAIIHYVSFIGDRGRVEYVYTYQNQKYLSGNFIQKIKRTEGLEAGQQVMVLVDRRKPKRAFIRNLYV